MASSSQVYRLVSPKWQSSAFTGEGARLYGGRWNSPGRRCVYLGGSRALAALELLVHLPSPESRAKSYRLIEAEVPEELCARLSINALPTDWQAEPPTQTTQSFGDDWLEACGSLGLWVPSVLMPEEWNLLINPEHPKAAVLKVGKARDFRFDPRLVV